ncbi:LysE/ArgO family amino acid transporter [Mariniluteicoccus flavus]
MTTASVLAALAGLGFGLSLIVAIGAQNAFVLRQGLRREHVLPVVAICALSDLVLIAAGVAGVGALIEGVPWLVTVIRFAGAAFLIVYALLAFRRALSSEKLTTDTTGAGISLRRAVLTAMAFTWLNPHVYLDTVMLLGSVANAYAGHRWAFAVGAGTGSIVWFAGLGFGARALGGVFAKPRAWQVFDIVIGVIMLALGVRLALG